jgi:hypothetical protein
VSLSPSENDAQNARQKKVVDEVTRALNEARARTFLDAADLVDHLAKGYASDPHKVRCRHIATELRAWAARTGGPDAP